MLQGEKMTLEISGINNEGEGVARVGDEHFVIFVTDALPGEKVSCRIVTAKKKYAIAKVLERYNDSPYRTVPRCKIFEKCGGCQLQHMNYTAQLLMKRQSVFDALKRIGGVAADNSVEISECMPSPDQWKYRNKVSVPVQSTLRENFSAGFYRRRSHDIVPFESCPVLLPQLEANTKLLIDEMRKDGFKGYKESAKKHVNDFIRHIVFRHAKYTDESLCGIVGTRNISNKEENIIKNIVEQKICAVNGLIYNKNVSKGNFIWGKEFRQICGRSEVNEILGKYNFSFEISSFFQINSAQALNLYKYVSELTSSNSCDEILELYSGVGSLTVFLADVAKNVTAVEAWEAASKYILINAGLNGLNNIKAYSGQAEDVIDGFSSNKYDAIVVDPPRTGCDAEVIKTMIKINPRQIIYVSCNPATLARDVRLLK
jgi:23S rRNA (uracil1939-C5)-methyltransferase